MKIIAKFIFTLCRLIFKSKNNIVGKISPFANNLPFNSEVSNDQYVETKTVFSGVYSPDYDRIGELPLVKPSSHNAISRSYHTRKAFDRSKTFG